MLSTGFTWVFVPPSLSPQNKDRVGGSPPSLLTSAENRAEEEVTFRGVALEIIGAVLSTMIRKELIPVPAKLVAVTLRSKLPVSRGLPTSSPFNELMLKPLGKRVAA